MCLWSIVLGAITDPLEPYCEDEADQIEWEEVPELEWYWGSDYNAQIAAGELVYPAGFKPYTLMEFNEPPVCMSVPNSGDKKVEILIETDVEDAHICIHDASDIGFANNDVGNVDTCGMGLLYACFTAAEAEDADNNIDDFSFYVYCKESCETSDVGIWMRVRTSEQTWDTGKTGVADDLEMWCEMEKGTVLNDSDGTEHNYFSYPENLEVDNPLNFPYEMVQITASTFKGSSGNSNTTAIVLVALFGILFFIIAGLCAAKNHDNLPMCCQKIMSCDGAAIDDYE